MIHQLQASALWAILLIAIGGCCNSAEATKRDPLAAGDRESAAVTADGGSAPATTSGALHHGPQATTADAGSPGEQAPPSEVPISAEDACLEKWLRERGLDSYGGRPGTQYTGGTPLFDERTGRYIDRRDYVYSLHPKAAAACRDPSRAPDGLPTE